MKKLQIKREGRNLRLQTIMLQMPNKKFSLKGIFSSNGLIIKNL